MVIISTQSIDHEESKIYGVLYYSGSNHQKREEEELIVVSAEKRGNLINYKHLIAALGPYKFLRSLVRATELLMVLPTAWIGVEPLCVNLKCAVTYRTSSGT